jgi:dTDP-4-amino-4,6-dideoxygalactose transaminase
MPGRCILQLRSCTSTIPIHTAEGGALTCSDKNLKEPSDLLKNFGTKDEDEVVMPGINGKMSEL